MADENGQSHSRTFSKGKAKCARLLVELGAYVNAIDKDDRTALHLASAEGSAKIVQLLIQHGADVNTQDKGLSTPLHLALTSVSVKSV